VGRAAASIKLVRTEYPDRRVVDSGPEPVRRGRSRLRHFAAVGAVGALVGLLIAGAGSRLAMRLVATADNREDFGSITDSGATVGEFTVAGTVDVLSTGIMAGVLGALLYVALRRGLPQRLWHTQVTFSLILLGYGLLGVVEGNTGDFVILDTAVSLGAFAAVILLCAIALPPLIEWVSPPVSRRSPVAHAIVLVVAGLAIVAGAFAVHRAFELADQDIKLTAERPSKLAARLSGFERDDVGRFISTATARA
jgi:hypothetical protein